MEDPDLVESYRHRALERARSFSWEAVADEYERLLSRVVSGREPGALPPELVDADAPPPTVAAAG
jgi:hypothetical protein